MKIYDIYKCNNVSSKHIALYGKGKKVSYDELEINIEQYARYFSCLAVVYEIAASKTPESSNTKDSRGRLCITPP
ncbi:MAG TPA: hypothetical protein DCK87_02815 [Desulfotomaculum sp.]|nr:hypothetical protein [Desulfotomaculum sp.]